MAHGLNYTDSGHGSPAIVFLHYFGGSANTWRLVIDSLDERYRCIAVDLPGFGYSAAPAKALSVNEQAQIVIELIQDLQLSNFVLAGHSMGGKIALVIAAQDVPGLNALILIAPSPPTPEPTDSHERQEIAAAWNNHAAIEKIINKITVKALTRPVFDQCLSDQLKVSQIVWDGWINGGSQEDISPQIRDIDQPLLLIAGTNDPNFPAVFLKKEFDKLYRSYCHEEICGGHLLPLEATFTLTEAACRFLKENLEC